MVTSVWRRTFPDSTPDPWTEPVWPWPPDQAALGLATNFQIDGPQE